MRISVKFNPALRRRLPPSDRRLWLLWSVGLRIEEAASPVWRFEVFHRRLGLAAVGLGLAGYLAAATALWFWLDRNPHNQATWSDVVQLPWAWDDLRRKRGDTAVLTAKARLEAGDYVEAFHFLRTGISRSPGNVEGRILLAQLLAGYEPQRAIELMESGLEHSGADPGFLAALFGFYGHLQAQDAALARIEELRAHPPAGLSDEGRAVIARTRAYLLSAKGRTDEALAELDSIPAGASASLARADILLRAGRAAEARTALAGVAAGAALPLAELSRREGDVAIALGDADGLLSALRRWRAATPDQPAPYLYGLAAWHRLNRASYRDSAEREYYQLFSRNDGALQALAALAVNLDYPELVDRVRHVATSHRASAFAYLVHATEIELRRARYESAVRQLRGWESAVETLQPAQRFYPEFIKRLARVAFSGGDTEADALVGHLVTNRGQAQLPIWLLAARTLDQAGQAVALQKLLRPALGLFPRTDELVALKSRLEQAASAVPQGTVPTSRATLAPASAAEALARLDDLLGSESLAAARDLLRAIRAERPVWLDAAAAEVGRREIELAFATLDPLASRSLVRQHLERHRDAAAAAALVELSRRFAAQDRVADARLLTDEILASQPAAEVRDAIAALKLPDDLGDHLASAANALAALDRWISASQWTQAERLLTAMRNRPPGWAAGEHTALKVREVQVRLGLGQRPMALAALKEIVIKSGAPRSAAFKLVRDYLVAGEQDTAIVLAREIVKLLPGDPAAQKLLEEARAPRPAGG